MGNTLIGIGIVVVVIVLYIVSYSLNKNTKLPDGVELPTSCGSCATPNCGLSTVNLKKTLSKDDVVNDLKELIHESQTNCVRK